MSKKLIALITVVIATSQALAQQEVTVDYQYEGSPNLSDISASLRFGEFSDARSASNPNLITDAALPGSSDGYAAEAPLAEIVREAFVQGFTSGGVDLLDSGEDMLVVGEIVASDAVITDRNGVESIQLTIRTNIALRDGNRTVYETLLFGRGTVPSEEGIVAAVHAALDRMVRELTRDDYFMIELQ